MTELFNIITRSLKILFSKEILKITILSSFFSTIIIFIFWNTLPSLAWANYIGGNSIIQYLIIFGPILLQALLYFYFHLYLLLLANYLETVIKKVNSIEKRKTIKDGRGFF